MIVDSHHHLWRCDRGDYHWMSAARPTLCRDYLMDDLRPHLRKAGVARTILVQAAQTEAETQFLLELARDEEMIAGVTGWLDLDDPGFADRLAAFRRNPKFVALRPMLQDLEDDAWILRPRVLASLALLAETRFPFEFLVYPRHLPHVIEALRQTPGLHAVVDHLSKPPIASGELEPWAGLMRDIGQHSNVWCKLSGMVTEADHAKWSPSDLTPYVATVIEAFGPERLMFGSDWPVCRLAAEYGEVVNALRTVLDGRLPPEAFPDVFGRNAIRFYGLGAPQ